MDAKLNLRGRFQLLHYRSGKLLKTYNVDNGIVNVGYDSLLNVMFNDATSNIVNWAIGLIDAGGFTALADTDTMSSHAGWSEFTSYSEGTRPEWDPGTASGQSITNATLRDFNITASGTLKGIFITSDATKSGTSGTLWSTALFAGDIPVANTDLIKIAYTVSK